MRTFFAVLVATCSLGGCGYFGFDPLVGSAGNDAATVTDSGTTDADTDAGTDAGPDAGTPTPRVADLCAFSAITVILDGDATDATVGAELASTVASACGTAPTVQSLDQTTPGLLDPTTHAPLFGSGTLGVVGGDNYYQNIMVYLEMTAAPIISTQTASDWIITRRSDQQVLVTRPLSTLDLTHDVSVIEVSRDPASGAVVLSAYGLYYRGTMAAAYHFANVLQPTIATDGRQYYVIEWTNADADPNPSAGDAFAVLSMGP